MSDRGYNKDGRVRKVDVNKLTFEQTDQLSEQIGGKVRDICDKAVAEANKLLNIYGLQCKMQFVLETLANASEDTSTTDSEE